LDPPPGAATQAGDSTVCTVPRRPATVYPATRVSRAGARNRGTAVPGGSILPAAYRNREAGSMAVFRIAVIGGDGIGPEVIDQAVRAAEKAAKKHDGADLQWNRLPWSTAYYKKTGRMLPADGWEQLKPHDAILFGAVGDPSVPDKITVHELLLPMRRTF